MISKHKQFLAVHADVSAGSLIVDAVKTHGVTHTGYTKWRVRHGLPIFQQKVEACSTFKAIEREIMANKTEAICRRFGVTQQQYFDRKSAAYDRLPLLIRVRQAVLAAPKTPEICDRHGVTLAQLYRWRQATGGLPK